MSAAKARTSCAFYENAMSAFIDGELAPGHAAEMQAHLTSCAHCFEEVELMRATRSSLRKTNAVRAPAALRERMALVMASQAHASPSKTASSKPEVDPQGRGASPKLIPFRYAMGLAVAASAVIGVGIVKNRSDNGASAASMSSEPTAAIISAGIDDFIDDFVDVHARPLPPETTDPNGLMQFDQYVGVPVRRPALPSIGVPETSPQTTVQFKGARMFPIRGQRATALLYYATADGHRATVYVFDARALPIERTRLKPRFVKERPVFVGNVRGYNVAATQRSGVGYALATDVDTDVGTTLAMAVQ